MAESKIIHNPIYDSHTYFKGFNNILTKKRLRITRTNNNQFFQVIGCTDNNNFVNTLVQTDAIGTINLLNLAETVYGAIDGNNISINVVNSYFRGVIISHAPFDAYADA